MPCKYHAGTNLTISRMSGLGLWIIVYSNGFRKSFWNLKCGSSSFSRNRIASWRRESKAKMPTCGLLWQHTLKRRMWNESTAGYNARDSLCWNALLVYPINLTTPVECGSCCNKISPQVSEGWTNEDFGRGRRTGFLSMKHPLMPEQNLQWRSIAPFGQKGITPQPEARTPDR